MFNGKIHYKWSFSIAVLNYQRVYYMQIWIRQTILMVVDGSNPLSSHFPKRYCGWPGNSPWPRQGTWKGGSQPARVNWGSEWMGRVRTLQVVHWYIAWTFKRKLDEPWFFGGCLRLFASTRMLCKSSAFRGLTCFMLIFCMFAHQLYACACKHVRRHEIVSVCTHVYWYWFTHMPWISLTSLYIYINNIYTYTCIEIYVCIPQTKIAAGRTVESRRKSLSVCQSVASSWPHP